MTAVSAVKIWVKALLRNIAWLLHPRLPWPIARRLMKRRIAKQLQSPFHQAVALQQMTHLLSDVATPDEIAAAARRYTAFSLLEAELRWHPSRSVNQHVEGVENLQAALGQGNGVVLHFAHHAFYSGMFAAVRRASDVDLSVLVRDKALGWNVGPSLRQHMLVVQRGGELVYTGEGSAGIADRLARGEVIAMASDTSGSSTPMFAGHEVKCSSGAVWTARKANAPIVIVDSFKVGDNHVIRLSEPIDPNAHDPQNLLQLLISAHEKAILAWPEATFAPVLSWQRAVPAAEAVVRETSVIAPKPLAKALVDNAAWMLHLRLPWPLAERRLAKRIARAQQSPAHDALAADQMNHLLGKISTPEEIEQAKTRYTAFSLAEAELRWHPRRAIDQQVEGIEHVRAAQALGRGVVVSFVHHGYYAGMFGAIKRAGLDHVTVVRAGALGWNAGPGQRQNFLVFKRGGPLIDVREGTAGFIKRLARGEVMMIATDIPGTSIVSFAGRQVKCSSGLVWAARAANTPIVVLDSFQTENGHVVRFSKPLLPEDFDDAQSLLQEVVSQHEQAILAWPEAAFVPTLSWVSAEA
jgi:lauroyl/myristoyl acyltransferase